MKTNRVIRAAAFLVLGICLSDSRPAAAQSWPMYQVNPSHTGYMPVSLDPGQFYVRWSKRIGGIHSVNPVAAGDGRVYATLLINGDDVTQLFALRTTDGSTLWSKGFGGVFSVNPPAYVNGTVYLQTCNHTPDTWLWAFDGGSGTKLFQVPHTAQWERYYAPTVFGGGVYVNGGYYGGMYGFNGSNGNQLWFDNDLPFYDEWTPAVDGTRAFAYLGDYAPGLYIKKLVDGTDAQPVGFIPDPDFEWDGWSMYQAPVIGGAGEVLAINNQAGRLIAFDPLGGTIAWQLKDRYTGQPSVAGGRIYVVNNGGLSVLDESSHTLLWSWMPPSGAITQPMIVTDTHVLVSTQNTVYAVDLTTHDALWSFAAAYAKLAIADGTLFVAGYDGFLTAIALTSNVKPTSINPNTGPSIGGTPVTITGSGFQAGATVTFGGNPATVTSVTPSQILATTPPHLSGPVDVVIINPDLEQGRLLGGFTYTCGATAPTATVSGSASICAGNSTNLSVALTGSGPWTLYWSDGTVQSGIGSSPATRSVSPSSTTTYAVTTVTDTNCAGAGTGSATVTVNSTPSAAITAPASVCSGATGIAASVPDGGAGVTYSWSITNGTITSGASTRAITFSAGASGTVQVSVTVTHGGCSANSSADIPISALPTAAVSGDATICAGQSTPLSIVLTGTAPWTLTWSDGAQQGGIAASPATRNVSPAGTTTYTVTGVVDATSCAGTASGSAAITVKPSPNATITAPASTCPNTTGLVASVADAGAGATYAWTISNGSITGGTGTRSITFSAGPAGPVGLGVTVTQGGCLANGSASVTVYTPPTATLSGPSTTCAGANTPLSVALTGSGPWTIHWSDGFVQAASSSPAIRTVAPISDTTYSLASVSGAGGCAGSVSGSVTITVKPAPTAVVSGGDTGCPGVSVTIQVAVTASGNWTAQWNDGYTQTGTGSGAFTRSVSPLTTRSYQVVSITDSSCSGAGTGSAVVTVLGAPSASIRTAMPVCSGATNLVASVAVPASGAAYTWKISNGAITSGQGTPAITFSAGAPGPLKLSVSATGVSGCSQSGELLVDVQQTPAAPVVTAPASATTGTSGLVAEVPAKPGSTFVWSVDNGTITSGNGTNRIVFRAGDPGDLVVHVSERSSAGCLSPETTQTVKIEGVTAVRMAPAAVHAVGVGGSFFTTELTLANPGPATMTVDFVFTPSGAGGAPVSTHRTVPPGGQIFIPDVVGPAMSASRAVLAGDFSASGSLRVTLGNLPYQGVAYVGARTTTPSGGGNAGVAYAAPLVGDLAATRVYVPGLRETAADRSNLAMVNAGTTGDIELRVTLFSGASADSVRSFVLPDLIALSPGQWVQIGSVLARAHFTNGYALVERASGSEPFLAYGVVNDNVTNDGSWIGAIPATRTPGVQVLPVVAEVGSFSSELILTNPSTRAVNANLAFTESLAHPGGFFTGTFSEALLPGEQKIIPNAIGYLRGRGAPVGAQGSAVAGTMTVTFSANYATVEGFAGVRTTSPAAGGGRYGVYSAAVLMAETASAEAWVFGLKQDAETRSNLGLLNASGNQGPVTLVYDVFDGDTGKKVASSKPVTLGPAQWTQVSSVLRTYGLANGYVRIVRTDGKAGWVAYGVLNDGAVSGAGTGDGSFLTMALAP